MKVILQTKNQEDLKVNLKKQLTDGNTEMAEISLGSGSTEEFLNLKPKAQFKKIN